MIDRFAGEYSWLSNFSQHMIAVQDIMYPTVEHFYQCQKAVYTKDFLNILHTDTPGKAKRAGAKLTFKNGKLREDWYDISLGVMYEGVYAKFKQHDSLNARLQATFPHHLVEGNDWGDTFWGKVNGEGSNHLGIILENVRDVLDGGEDGNT